MSQELIFKLNIQGPGESKVVQLSPGISQLGRQEGNQILLADTLVSRQHARLECDAGGCQLVDLGSSNGTYLNQEKLKPNSPVLLKNGDQIKIGPFILDFSQVLLEVEEDLPPKVAAKETEKPAQIDQEKQIAEQKKVKKDGKIPPPPAESLTSPADKQPDFFSKPEYLYSRKLLQYLPGIYHTDFMSRLLALFETVLLPIEWTVDNFDLFLSPLTTPSAFIPWLENWFSLPPAVQWNEVQKRTFLSEAHLLYARRGTRWALSRLLEIHCSSPVKVVDAGENLEPFTFIVKIPLRNEQVNPTNLFALIDASKPAYTTYRIEFLQS